jgi:hypothetical protein
MGKIFQNTLTLCLPQNSHDIWTWGDEGLYWDHVMRNSHTPLRLLTLRLDLWACTKPCNWLCTSISSSFSRDSISSRDSLNRKIFNPEWGGTPKQERDPLTLWKVLHRDPYHRRPNCDSGSSALLSSPPCWTRPSRIAAFKGSQLATAGCTSNELNWLTSLCNTSNNVRGSRSPKHSSILYSNIANMLRFLYIYSLHFKI